MKFLLDTDTCISTLRHDPGVRSYLESVTPDEVAIIAFDQYFHPPPALTLVLNSCDIE